MSLNLITFNTSLLQKQAITEVLECNKFTVNYGLSLTSEQAAELVETRFQALNKNGRIEFGGGIIDKLIERFCDSPYITRQNYVDTLHELLEIFYYYKNETLDQMSDDELIEYMKNSFNGVCQGSLELLSGRELDKIAHNIRFGHNYDYYDDDESEEDEGYEDEDGEY